VSRAGRQGLVVPGHDIVSNGRGRNSSRRICLHALCISYQHCPLQCTSRAACSIELRGWRTLKSRIKRRRAAVDIMARSIQLNLIAKVYQVETRLVGDCESRSVRFGAGVEMRE
jgi:hypothetical protein